MTRLKTGTLALIGVLLLAVTLFVTPAAGATSKAIKLTGVVVGRARTCGMGNMTVGSCRVVSLRRGSSEVGKLSVGTLGCVPRFCEFDGSGTLSVGKLKLPKQLKGKLHVKITFRGTGNIVNPVPYKYGTGRLYANGGKAALKIRVNGNGIPNTIGAHFGVVLSQPSV